MSWWLGLSDRQPKDAIVHRYVKHILTPPPAPTKMCFEAGTICSDCTEYSKLFVILTIMVNIDKGIQRYVVMESGV